MIRQFCRERNRLSVKPRQPVSLGTGKVEAPEFNVDAGSSMVVVILSGTSMSGFFRNEHGSSTRVSWEDESNRHFLVRASSDPMQTCTECVRAVSARFCQMACAGVTVVRKKESSFGREVTAGLTSMRCQ